MSTQARRADAAPTSLKTADVVPSLTNPRKGIDKGALAELAASIRSKGILQPVLVRPWPASRKASKEFPEASKRGFEIVAGERRWRAAVAADLGEIPVVVRELSDDEAIAAQMIENLQRADLHALEEAEGYRQLMAKEGYDVARIAEETGRSIKYVYDRVKLLSLTKEAKKDFAEGRFTAGHAILLARLKPEDQRRAMQHGALYESQRLLWDPSDGGAAREELKPVSVRELQAWIDKHVRFEEKDAHPLLFPETAERLGLATEAEAKVIPISRDHQLHPDARGEGRVLCVRSWKRADGDDGSKTCEHSVLGMVVAGPGRGEAFGVCTKKDRCTVHWGAEIRAKKRRKNEAAKEPDWQVQQRQEEERRERERAEAARWNKARPKILQALAQKVAKAPARAEGFLAGLLVKRLERSWGATAVGRLVPRGKTAEDLVRHLAMMELAAQANDWNARQSFPKVARALGVDAIKILDAVAPRPKAAAKDKPARKKPARKAAPKKATRRKR